MTPTIQSGMHPDADTMTAFVEQLLPANEREQVLAHMSTCSRCREVIFLARQATAEEPVTLAASAPVEKQRAWWLGGWRWAWIPVGAMAALIGVAVVLHFRRAETATQMARNASPAEAVKQSPMQQASPALATNRPQPAREETNAPQKPKPPVVRDRETAERKQVLDQKAAGQRELALGAAAAPVAIQPGVGGGSTHGAFTARAKATPYDGPMANQLQQNALQQQNATQQNAQAQQKELQPAQNLDEATADKRVIAGTAPGPPSETVTMQADAAEKPRSQAPAPAPPAQPSYAPIIGKDGVLSPAATAQLKKAATIALPGGAQPLSVAFAVGRTVALDTSGALFLSEDQGRHWQPVATQWTGRAVLVRNLQQSRNQSSLLQAAPAVRFELVNDKLQTWKSPDGKTWTAEIPPSK